MESEDKTFWGRENIKLKGPELVKKVSKPGLDGVEQVERRKMGDEIQLLVEARCHSHTNHFNSFGVLLCSRLSQGGSGGLGG